MNSIKPYRVMRWLNNLILVIVGLWCFFSATLIILVTALWLWVAFQLPDLQTLLNATPGTCKTDRSAIPTPLQRWRIDALAAVESPGGLNPFGTPTSRLIASLVVAPIVVVSGHKLFSPKKSASEALADNLSYRPDSKDRTLLALFKRLVLSDIVELRMSEEAIGKELLARSYFGKYAIGLDCAAAIRYNTTVDNLTLGRYAMLIGLMKAPTMFDPDKHKEAALERRNSVLDLWRDKGIATQADVEKAKLEPL
jgi:Transglycosylase